MKLKNLTTKLSAFRYLLFLPFLFLTFCQSSEEEVIFNTEGLLTKDSKIISLMKAAVQSSSDGVNTKSTSAGTDQCTEFKYPMTFYVYKGDNPEAQEIIVNSDEELLSFFDTLTTTSGLYILFPITLIDVDGVETVINDLTEFEGTLQMLVDACTSDDDSDDSDDSDDDSDNNDDDSDDNDDSDDDDSDDDSSDDDDSDDDNDDDNSDDNDDSDDDSDDSDDDSDDNDDGSDDNDDSDDDDSNDDDDNGTYDFCHKNNKKVYICHKGQTICVSINAIWGHLNQHEEDFLGKCE